LARKHFFIDADDAIDGSPLESFLNNRDIRPHLTVDPHAESRKRWRIVVDGDDHRIREYHNAVIIFTNIRPSALRTTYTVSDLIDDETMIQ
jgi:hypothetical protein